MTKKHKNKIPEIDSGIMWGELITRGMAFAMLLAMVVSDRVLHLVEPPFDNNWYIGVALIAFGLAEVKWVADFLKRK